MKSELRTAWAPPARPAPEAFRTFFDALEQPAALCDRALGVLAANAAFERLCAAHGLAPAGLASALAGSQLPVPGEARDVEVELPRGERVLLRLVGQGDEVAVLGRSSGAEHALAAQAREEAALLTLGREVAGAEGEEALLAAAARAVQALFPGRSYCVRILDGKSGALTSLYAQGRLLEPAGGPLVLSERAVEKMSLALEGLAPERVQAAAEVPLLFVGSAGGVSAPLASGGQLYGAIHLEWPQGLAPDAEHDERLLVQLANQVAVAVKNAKLIDELTFVRGYLEELLEKANALILVVNPERKVAVFNQALAQLCGYDRFEVLGRDVLEFIPEADQLRVTHFVACAMRGESVGAFETRLRARRGEVRVSLSLSSVRGHGGELEGVIAIGQDVTVVKELEKRIIHAEKLANLGQLAASVAHEINNPLTAVTAYADALLQRARVDPRASVADQDKLRKILENAHRVLRFTRDLVTYARPPSHDRPERVSLASVLDAAVGYCEHALRQAHASVDKQYGEVPPLSGVRANLVQVFVNLITNACHALPQGGRIVLRTRREGQEAVAEVHDSGGGIPPEDLPRIFEPFFTTKPEGKGTGLGLSIVQGIVDSHGGRIDVASCLGAGTTFTLRLPLAE